MCNVAYIEGLVFGDLMIKDLQGTLAFHSIPAAVP